MKTNYISPCVQFILLLPADVLTTSGELEENWSKFYSVDDIKDDIF